MVAFDAGLGEFAKRVENARIGSGMVGDFGVEKSGIKGGQQIIHLRDGNAQAGGVEVLDVFMPGDFGGEVEPEAHFLDPSLVVKPFLVATGAPAGKVIGADVVASLGEFFDNKGIW